MANKTPFNFILRSSFGILFYIIIQNRFVWKILPAKDKELILGVNKYHNTFRSDYYQPKKYQDGMNWDTSKNDGGDYRKWGRELSRELIQFKGKSVLELGPGSGYYTYYIFKSGIKRYIGVELNNMFIKYLQPRLAIAAKKSHIDYQLLHGDLKNQIQVKVNRIIIFSALHHIPDRDDVFKSFDKILETNGKLIAFEPTHYLPRITTLLWKWVNIYHKKSFYEKINNLSTHTFLTSAEYHNLAKKLNWVIEYESYRFPRKVVRVIKFINMIFNKSDGPDFFSSPVAQIFKWLSIECVVVMKK